MREPPLARQKTSHRGEDVADATSSGANGYSWGAAAQHALSGSSSKYGDRGRWWLVEPDVGRVAHGVPQRVDRLRSLGNAVVPQIPEIIGRAIMTSMTSAQGTP